MKKLWLFLNLALGFLTTAHAQVTQHQSMSSRPSETVRSPLTFQQGVQAATDFAHSSVFSLGCSFHGTLLKEQAQILKNIRISSSLGQTLFNDLLLKEIGSWCRSGPRSRSVSAYLRCTEDLDAQVQKLSDYFYQENATLNEQVFSKTLAGKDSSCLAKNANTLPNLQRYLASPPPATAAAPVVSTPSAPSSAAYNELLKKYSQATTVNDRLNKLILDLIENAPCRSDSQTILEQARGLIAQLQQAGTDEKTFTNKAQFFVHEKFDNFGKAYSLTAYPVADLLTAVVLDRQEPNSATVQQLTKQIAANAHSIGRRCTQVAHRSTPASQTSVLRAAATAPAPLPSKSSTSTCENGPINWNAVSSQMPLAKQKNFLKLMGPKVERVAKANKMPMHAFLALMALESGWGQSDLAQKYNNFGGVKARRGHVATPFMATRERGVPTRAKFSSFDSVDEYMSEKVPFLKQSRYAACNKDPISPAFDWLHCLAKSEYFNGNASGKLNWARKIGRIAADLVKVGAYCR